MEEKSKLRTASWNVRAFLRNLWTNLIASLIILGLTYMADFFKITTLTPELETAVFWAVIAGMIAWVVFLVHCFGELVLQLRKSNYHFLWSFLPFLLPVIILLTRASAVTIFPWYFD